MKIAFFTSLGFGLEVWSRLGTISRELALYNSLVDLGWEVHVFTYERNCDIKELLKSDCLARLNVHPLLPCWIPICLRIPFVVFLPLVILRFFSLGRTFDVVKTNQGHAALHALIFAFLFHKPMVARSGYVLSEQLCNRRDRPLKDVIRACLERVVMRCARVCIVPTPFLVEWCKMNLKCRRLFLLPNNVDTERFAPVINSERRHHNCGHPVVLAVGRLSKEKRFSLLIHAAAITGVAVSIVGEGILRAELKSIAEKEGVSLNLLGRVANENLPALYNSADLFIICSEYEGHPKALIEAMACGCACIGTDSPGIRNQIKDNENGLIVEGTANGLAVGIKRLLANQSLADKIRQGARRYALENFSLEELAKKEDVVLRQVARK